MAVILRAGDAKKDYTIVRELNRGQFAIAYEAKSSKDGRVFFKQYKAPSKLVEWYQGFINHQQELKNRISSSPAVKELCYRFIEFFDDKAGFYQVFEFIEGNKTLQDCVDQPDHFTWEELVIFSRIMMLGVKGLHLTKIVHTDLKPENIILIPDPSISKKYRLRLIDMDWSIFTDRKAPWDGIEGYGYVGTPGYMSPEHVSGKVPSTASDIFTCGIMLGQILGTGHPFAAAEDFNKAILKESFKPIKLRQAIPKVSNPDFLETILNACLSANPAKRPTAEQVCNALMGDVFSWAGYVPKSPSKEIDSSKTTTSPSPTPPSSPKTVPPPALKPVPAPPSPNPSPAAATLQIIFEGKEIAKLNIDTTFGKALFKGVHPDAQFLSNEQFRLKKVAGQWMIEHIATATNQTIVNGRALSGSVPVINNMRVSVGNTSKGIEKFPLIIQYKS
jgi:eukaryotic-like serine/threonine-protein kinase